MSSFQGEIVKNKVEKNDTNLVLWQIIGKEFLMLFHMAVLVLRHIVLHRVPP